MTLTMHAVRVLQTRDDVPERYDNTNYGNIVRLNMVYIMRSTCTLLLRPRNIGLAGKPARWEIIVKYIHTCGG
jgi:hypothetical protein